MKEQKLKVINELTSPLFRIMAIHNSDEPARIQYDMNVCAFHIGNGYILSVAHPLKLELTIFRSIMESQYQADIVPLLTADELVLVNGWYFFDPSTNKRYLNMPDPSHFPQLVEILKRINYDTRINTLYESQICKPILIIQQKITTFFQNAEADALFNPTNKIYDSNAKRFNYLIELELVEIFWENDIALYRMVNTGQRIIDLIPAFEIDSQVYDLFEEDFFCLQGAPSDLTPGRMINQANIEGLIDQWNMQPDRIGGNYVFEGFRYLIKGYFRFGSSGAPYIKFDKETNRFKVNAIQSEGCPIQLTIDDKMIGNFQWVNAIATPLANVIEKINEHMNVN